MLRAFTLWMILGYFIGGGLWVHAQSRLQLPFESNPNQTLTYEQMLQFIDDLEREFSEVRILYGGITDMGRPIPYLLVSDRSERDHRDIQSRGKLLLMINNGIHPGEPEGIDATLAFLRNMLRSEHKNRILSKMALIVIPCYNIDGMVMRNQFSRVNQNGPESFGFRGNALNLDLNRDFIKSYSENTRAFCNIFHRWKPHIFLDTHTSNGADYQHTMTVLPTLPDKLGSPLKEILMDVLWPELFDAMQSKGDPICPYVVTKNGDPAEGIYGFVDSPRYSSGYAALWGAIPILTETHMLKPFIDRLNSTYRFIQSLIEISIKYKSVILEATRLHRNHWQSSTSYPYRWVLDLEKSDTILFSGYTMEQIPSKVSGAPLRTYKADAPYLKPIPYYIHAIAERDFPIPEWIILPQAWRNVIQLLDQNKIIYQKLDKDTSMIVSGFKIDSFESLGKPYEGHFFHHTVHYHVASYEVRFFKGDLMISTAQDGIRYLMELIIPDAEDSLFRWNFFDSVLMAKEGFSAYVWDELAQKILSENPQLKRLFEEKKNTDTSFAASTRDQLQFIYEHSPYYNPLQNVLPVYLISKL